MSQTTVPKPLIDPRQDAPSAEAFLKASRPILKKLDEKRVSKLRSYNLRKKLSIPIGVAAVLILGGLDMALWQLQSGNEDHFSGHYKQVGIEFSEIELTQNRGNSRRMVFKGLAILLSSGTKKFMGHTIIQKDRGFLDRQWQTHSKKLQRADLLDLEFEKQFDVFTTDQVEARYLIDPKIIESLKTLNDEFDGKNFSAAFYDEHVLILIASSKNRFEPASIHTPAVDTKTILSLRNEIAQILSIIDRLALYNRRNLRPA